MEGATIATGGGELVVERQEGLQVLQEEILRGSNSREAGGAAERH